MKASHRIVAGLGAGFLAAMRVLPHPAALRVGAGLGSLVGAIGIRRRVAEDNLRRAFPERTEAERGAILAAHYRELGRVAAEYARLGELARAEGGRAVVHVTGLEHLLAVRAAGRGAIVLTGHFGNFELCGATLGRWNPVDFVVRPLTNPGMERVIARARAGAGVGTISADDGIRAVFRSLAANRWIAMLADQDARRHGVFVPFFGRPASTPIGPARIALRTGAPIVMGFSVRRPDGGLDLEVLPPLVVEDPGAPDAELRLTALHTATLEAWVRRHPSMWLWLHKRWKTAPPADGG